MTSFRIARLIVLAAMSTAPVGADVMHIPPSRPGLVAVPLPPEDGLEAAVATQLRSLARSLEQTVQSGNISDTELSAAYGLLAQLYHAYELFDSAAPAYSNAAVLAPGDGRWPHLLGVLNRRLGRLDAAAADLERAVTLSPERVASVVALAEVYRELGRVAEARKTFKVALEADSNAAAAHAGLAELALADRQYEVAIAYFSTALELVPDANRLHYGRGMAYRGLEDLEQARQELAKAGSVGVKAADPLLEALQSLVRGERVHLVQGQVAFSAGRVEEARDAFAAAVAANPDSVAARINFATTSFQLGDAEAALTNFRAALELDPGNPLASYNLGALLVSRGEYAESVSLLRVALEATPRDVEANRALVKALIAVREDDEAVERLERLVAAVPDDEALLLQLTDLLVVRGAARRSIAILESAHQRHPERGLTAAALARLLAASPDLETRDGARAVELAQKIVEAKPSSTSAVTLALAFGEAGRCAEAAQVMNELVASAEGAGRADLATRWRAEQVRYENGAPCRPAVSSAQSP